MENFFGTTPFACNANYILEDDIILIDCRPGQRIVLKPV